MITIQPITEDNFREVLALRASEKLVAPNAMSLAEAYLSLKKAVDSNEINSNEVEMPFAIVSDEIVIGFLMISFEDGEDIFSDDGHIYWLSRFMIDEKYQGKGLGKAALLMLIDYIKTKPNGNEVKSFYTSVVQDSVSPVAAKFYESVGFKKTGNMLEDEEIMRLVL